MANGQGQSTFSKLAVGFAKGLAASSRGNVNALVQIEQAKTQRERDVAMLNLEQTRLDLQQKNAEASQALQRLGITTNQEIELSRQKSDLQAKREEFTFRKELQQAVNDGLISIEEVKQRYGLDIVEQQGETAENVAGIGATGALDVATTQGETAVEVAGIGATGALDVANIQGVVELAKAQAANLISNRKLSLEERALGISEQKLGLEFGVNPDGTPRTAQAGDTPFLSTKAREEKAGLASRVAKDKVYQNMIDIRDGYDTALAGFTENSGFGDLAMVNGFQRVIDPGVSVREGDVTLLAQAAGKLSNWLNLPASFFQGDRLRPEARQKLFDQLNEQYGLRAQNFQNQTKARFENDIAQNPFLAGKVDFKDIGFDFAIPGVTDAELASTKILGTLAAGVPNLSQVQPAVIEAVRANIAEHGVDVVRRDLLSKKYPSSLVDQILAEAQSGRTQ